MLTLNEGQKISYEIATEGGRTSAANLKAVDCPTGYGSPSSGDIAAYLRLALI